MTTFRQVARVAALVTLSTIAFPFDFSALKPEGYVSDFARVLDPETKAKVERYCTAVEQSTGAQLAVVTIDTLEGEPVEDVANLIYRTWKIGSKKSNEGALLLLAVKDQRQELRIEARVGRQPVNIDKMTLVIDGEGRDRNIAALGIGHWVSPYRPAWCVQLL